MDPFPHSLRDAPVRLDLEQIHLNGSFPPRLHVIDPSCTLNVAERVAELRHTDLFPELSWNALPYPAVLFFFCFRDVSCRRQYEVPKSTFESCKKKQMGFLLRPDAVCIGLSTSEQHIFEPSNQCVWVYFTSSTGFFGGFPYEKHTHSYAAQI